MIIFQIPNGSIIERSGALSSSNSSHADSISKKESRFEALPANYVHQSCSHLVAMPCRRSESEDDSNALSLCCCSALIPELRKNGPHMDGLMSIPGVDQSPFIRFTGLLFELEGPGEGIDLELLYRLASSETLILCKTRQYRYLASSVAQGLRQHPARLTSVCKLMFLGNLRHKKQLAVHSAPSSSSSSSLLVLAFSSFRPASEARHQSTNQGRRSW